MNVVLYAGVDLNLIDGSSIWLVSVADALSSLTNSHVKIICHTPPSRGLVSAQLEGRPNVDFINPWDTPIVDGALVHSRVKRLTPELAAAAIHAQSNPDSLLIVRHDEVLLALESRRPQYQRIAAYICNPPDFLPEKISTLRSISSVSDIMFCQTEQAESALRGLLPDFSGEILRMPPMVPVAESVSSHTLDPNKPRLVYAGKFSPHYNALEMLEAFAAIREVIPNAEFHIIGDKFHNSPPVRDFENRLRKGFASNGVVWHGGVSRQETLRLISSCDVAASWRHPIYDDNVELSTKILEYASVGVPALINRNPVQESVYGATYPGYVDSPTTFANRFVEIVSQPSAYSALSQHCKTIAANYSIPAIAKRLHDDLVVRPNEDRAQPASRRSRFLFAGHNLHFVDPILEDTRRNGHGVTVDQWSGHQGHSPEKSAELLRTAEVVWCEWCLGNAVWYSHHVKPHQQLIIRLHSQEMRLPYLDRLNWDSVHSLIAICDKHYRTLIERYPNQRAKIKLIYNAIDTAQLAQEKMFGAAFNLGLVGMVPRLKNPRLAFEILEGVREKDSRFTLYILGKRPEEYPWMRDRHDELRYYDETYELIQNSDHRDAVVFEPYTNDVSSWYSKIGYILSTSDHEGSHQAVAEGMATGCVPVIRNWDGAAEMYGVQHLFSTKDEAVQTIIGHTYDRSYEELAQQSTTFAKRFDRKAIWEAIADLIR